MATGVFLSLGFDASDLKFLISAYLGPTTTFTQAHYQDHHTLKFKTSANICYDERMNDTATPTPNYPQLHTALGRFAPPESELIKLPHDLVMSLAFLSTEIVMLTVPIQYNHTSLGLWLSTCDACYRVYTSDIEPGSTCIRISDWHQKCKGAYVVHINGHIVFSEASALQQLTYIITLAPTLITPMLEMIVTPDLPLSLPPALLCRHPLPSTQSITHAMYIMVEVITIPSDEAPTPDQLEDLVYSNTVSDGMVPGSKWTHRQLKRLNCWPEWHAAEKEKLYGMALANKFGKPESRPTGAIVLRYVWQYHVKHDGRKKSRTCCDSSVIRSKSLKYAEQFYSACISQMEIFFAYAMIREWVIVSGDVVKAYAQTDMPKGEVQYMAVNQHMIDWWLEKHGIRLSLDMVCRINMNLQGHPCAGQWWTEKILQHLKAIGFCPLRHKVRLYINKYEEFDVLVCRQTDDFMFGGKNSPSLRRLENLIGNEVDFLITPGLVEHYTDLKVVHARDCIHIHIGPYVDKILNTHGWATAGKDENRIIEPVDPNSIKAIETSKGPKDPMAEKSIDTAAGFKNHTTIGEANFAYVTCRLSIGYAIAELSKFSTCPTTPHYATVNRLFRYLRQPYTYCLVYWRPKPLDAIPHVTFPHLHPLNKVNRQMPMLSSIDVLCGHLESTHANCLHMRRSVGAHGFCLAGTAIGYRAKWIEAICLSSAECQFVTTIGVAKVTKLLRAIILQISICQLEATELYEDNAAAIMMSNEKRPTDRSRHINIQHFALHERVTNGELILRHIRGIINPDDYLTKALVWLLHHRHSTRVMIMYGSR
jgi:hypothetical protein